MRSVGSSFLLAFMLSGSVSSAGLSMSRTEQQFKLCTSCHGDKGQGIEKLKAPAIAGLQAWYVEAQLKKFRSRVRGSHPADVPGMRMGPMSRTLKEADISPMAAYVSKLPRPKLEHSIVGNPERGKQLYGVCVTCHGADAMGNKALGAPSLIGQNDWYLKSQLKSFQNGWRGADPTKDPIGATMAPMSRTLPNDEAIHDVIDYILALQGVKGTPKK